MPYPRRDRIAALLLLSGSLLAPLPAAALSYVMVRDEALVETSQGAGVFEVTSVTASPARGETRYSLQPIETLYGSAPGKSETLVLPGFATVDAHLAVEGIPFLKPGQQVLLFHSRRTDGDLQATNLVLGMFFPVETPDGELYVRHLDESMSLGGGKNAAFAVARDARRFEQWIIRHASGGAAKADYLTDFPDSSAKFNLIQLNFNNPMYPVGPGRWRIFDQGNAMRWFAPAGGQQGSMVQNEFQLLQAGMQAWVADPGSRILMTYVGTNVPNPTPTDGAVVRWNDPDNQINPDYDCSPGGGGTIGFGGSSASSSRYTHDGNPYYPLSRGFVVTSSTAACVLDDDGGRTGAEFFAHEIGHVLGFAHSCGDSNTGSCNGRPVADDATMRAFIHGDGRGGALAADDIAAARFLYEDDTVQPPSANLSLELSVTPTSAERGDALVYSAIVANAGPDAATNVEVTFDLPANVSYEGGSGSGWSCSSTGENATCTRGAALASGANSTVSINVDIPMDYPGPSTLTASASVTSAVADPATGNNSDSVISQVSLLLDRLFGDGFEG